MRQKLQRFFNRNAIKMKLLGDRAFERSTRNPRSLPPLIVKTAWSKMEFYCIPEIDLKKS